MNIVSAVSLYSSTFPTSVPKHCQEEEGSASYLQYVIKHQSQHPIKEEVLSVQTTDIDEYPGSSFRQDENIVPSPSCRSETSLATVVTSNVSKFRDDGEIVLPVAAGYFKKVDEKDETTALHVQTSTIWSVKGSQDVERKISNVHVAVDSVANGSDPQKRLYSNGRAGDDRNWPCNAASSHRKCCRHDGQSDTAHVVASATTMLKADGTKSNKAVTGQLPDDNRENECLETGKTSESEQRTDDISNPPQQFRCNHTSSVDLVTVDEDKECCNMIENSGRSFRSGLSRVSENESTLTLRTPLDCLGSGDRHVVSQRILPSCEEKKNVTGNEHNREGGSLPLSTSDISSLLFSFKRHSDKVCFVEKHEGCVERTDNRRSHEPEAKRCSLKQMLRLPLIVGMFEKEKLDKKQRTTACTGSINSRKDGDKHETCSNHTSLVRDSSSECDGAEGKELQNNTTLSNRDDVNGKQPFSSTTKEQNPLLAKELPPSLHILERLKVAKVCKNGGATTRQGLRRQATVLGMKRVHNFPAGIARQCYNFAVEYPLRIWIVDNSGSMATGDGKKYVEEKGRVRQLVNCTRFDELRDSVLFHANLAADIGAPTMFRLLNDPNLPALARGGTVDAPQVAGVCVRKVVNRPQPKPVKKAGMIVNPFKRGAKNERDKNSAENATREIHSTSALQWEGLWEIDQACQTDSDALWIDRAQDDLDLVKKVMFETEPRYKTPLACHIWAIYRQVKGMRPFLKEAGDRKVVVVIASDGIPDDQEALQDAMLSFQKLPVVVIVRLCTNDEAALHFWNTLDLDLKISIQILDDFEAEAEAVSSMNPWLNYCMPVQRAREWGFHHKLIDMMKARQLTHSELREYCAMIFGVSKSELSDPLDDWENFYSDLVALQTRESRQWNPLTKSNMALIDMRKMASIYGGKMERMRKKRQERVNKLPRRQRYAAQVSGRDTISDLFSKTVRQLRPSGNLSMCVMQSERKGSLDGGKAYNGGTAS